MSKQTLFAATMLIALLASFSPGSVVMPTTAHAAVNLTQYVNPLMGTRTPQRTLVKTRLMALMARACRVRKYLLA